jgi:hypothetical protein
MGYLQVLILREPKHKLSSEATIHRCQAAQVFVVRLGTLGHIQKSGQSPSSKSARLFRDNRDEVGSWPTKTRIQATFSQTKKPAGFPAGPRGK